MNRGYAFYLLLFLLVNSFSYAQINAPIVYQMHGEVLDESDSLRGLRDVSIYNKTRKQNYVTNENGKFSIPVYEGDTLRFHRLGYGRKFYFFRSFIGAENYSVQIILNTDTIHLKPFVVKSLTRESEIKNLFMNSFIRDSLRMITYLKRLQSQQSKNNFLRLQDFSQSPISFIYDAYSRKARNRRKIERAREIIKQSELKEDYAR